MRTLCKVGSFFTVLALLLVLCAVPITVTAESGLNDPGQDCFGNLLPDDSSCQKPVETAFVSTADNMVPVDAYIHPSDSGGLSERPANGYYASFRETLLQTGFSLSTPPHRFPLPGYAGRIRCMDAVIAFNLGGNAPPLSHCCL